MPAQSGLEPSGAAQPTLNQAYSTAGNDATKNPSEQASTRHNTQLAHDTTPVAHRGAHDGSDSKGTPSALGRGIHGAPPGEEAKGLTNEDVGAHRELEGEQMRASGEGEVRDAVMRKSGAGNSEPSLTSDLDRKKAEQAPMREAIKEERQEKVDVGGALSDRGGPANPVGKKGYPN